jgi:phosphotransferase system  glucose/maltose/N-acetylglucosamine-specific IIC component
LKPEEIAGSVVGAILVLVVGLLIVALAIGVFVYCIRSKRIKQPKPQVDER